MSPEPAPAATTRFRRATPDDAAAILRLFDDAIAWFVRIGNTGQWGSAALTGQAQWEARAAEWCAAPDSWVAEHAQVGVSGALVIGDAVPYVPAATEPELYVRTLIGSRDPRARGTGRQLLRLAEERALAAGVGLLRVDCYAGGSGDLIAFYESCGFERVGTFAVGDWPGQVLQRRLA